LNSRLGRDADGEEHDGVMDRNVIDAWLLEAVRWGPRWAKDTDPTPSTSLADVIGAGDAIGKAIFERTEVELAAGRLRAAGLLETHGDQFALTPMGQRLMGRSPVRHGWRRVEWLADELRSRESPDNARAVSLSEEAWQDALADYERRFRDALS